MAEMKGDLTYSGTSLDTIASVVVGARDRGQLPVRWGNVAQLVVQVWSAFVHSCVTEVRLVVYDVV